MGINYKKLHNKMSKRYRLFRRLYPEDFDSHLTFLNYQALCLTESNVIRSEIEVLRWIERGLYKEAKSYGLAKFGAPKRWRRREALISEIRNCFSDCACYGIFNMDQIKNIEN